MYLTVTTSGFKTILKFCTTNKIFGQHLRNLIEAWLLISQEVHELTLNFLQTTLSLFVAATLIVVVKSV